MNLRFYLDEDVDISLSQALKNRGVDIVTTQKAGNTGSSDQEQLLYAKEQQRVVISHNIRDFVLLHKNFLSNNRKHGGIIVSDQLPIGTLLRRTMRLWFTLDANDMENRIEFLSNWK